MPSHATNAAKLLQDACDVICLYDYIKRLLGKGIEKVPIFFNGTVETLHFL